MQTQTFSKKTEEPVKKDVRKSGRLVLSQFCSASGSSRSCGAQPCSCAERRWQQPDHAIGLGAIAFCGNSLELLDGSLQLGFLGLVAGVSRLGDQNALLGRLDIRQTKHLLWQIENT